jgi:hypothetical protein
MRALLAYYDTYMRLFVYNGVVMVNGGISSSPRDSQEQQGPDDAVQAGLLRSLTGRGRRYSAVEIAIPTHLACDK